MLNQLLLPVAFKTRDSAVELRRAVADDLQPLMKLLADDPVSASRGDVADVADVAAYRNAFSQVSNDSSNELVVVTDQLAGVVGTLQLTRIPGMARRGSTRLIVEAVRVSRDRRSEGIGETMLRWVTNIAAPALGVSLVQLTSDSARHNAHRFYERLGFVGSHVGFKYQVSSSR